MTQPLVDLTWDKAQPLGVGTDLSVPFGSGFYEVTSPTNGPIGVGPYLLLHMRSNYNGARCVQVAYDLAGPVQAETSSGLFVRNFDGETWGEWQELSIVLEE